MKAVSGGASSASSNITAAPGEPANEIIADTPEERAALTQAVPETFALHGNHPNPFNPSTEIRFDLPEAAQVRLVVYDLLGREVARLVNRELETGYQRVRWEAEVPSGVYLYRLDAGHFSQTRRMVLLK